MANVCEFGMRVIGKKLNVKTLIDWFNNEYDDDYHMFGILNPPDKDEFKAVTKDYGLEDIITYDTEGACKWSVAISLRDNNKSYYKTSNDKFKTNIELAAKELDLKIEIVSIEISSNMTEHLILNRDRIIEDETSELFTEEELELDPEDFREVEELIYENIFEYRLY